MQPTDKERASVEKFNWLLLTELGAPGYSWQWSEDITILVQDTHEDGTPKYRQRVNPKSLLIEVVPSYTAWPMCAPFVDEQWVLCSRLVMTQELWRRAHGESQELPENGRWMPMSGPSGYVCLPKGKSPNQEETWEVIRLIREARSITQQQKREASDYAMARREAASKARIHDFNRDAIPAFAGVPGTKGDYSFGGIGKTRKRKRKAA